VGQPGPAFERWAKDNRPSHAAVDWLGMQLRCGGVRRAADRAHRVVRAVVQALVLLGGREDGAEPLNLVCRPRQDRRVGTRAHDGVGKAADRSAETVVRGILINHPHTLIDVRVVTWNVNSIKQRLPRFLPWLDERRPDVVCLQETKLADDAFNALLGAELGSRGYDVAAYGEVQWNGVAILSRVGLEDVVRGLPGGPGFPEPEARAVSAICGGVRITSVYVPNGREPDSDHYHYKLRWLASLRDFVTSGPEDAIVCGDMNIAPADADVFDPQAYVGQTHVTGPERAALAELLATGLRDVVRERWPTDRVFTYWDYRAGMFHQDLGMRIDLVLASAGVADRVAATWVDRHARKGTGPSDHAPVIVDLDDAPDGDIGPVIPPPSSPRKGGRPVKLPQATAAKET